MPAHWKVVRAKGLFSARTERARDDDEQLSATQAYGVIPQKEFERRVGRRVVQITQHLDKRAHVEPDDFVISMRSFQGGLERAWSRGCIRSSYVVLKPSSQARVGYFSHLFKSQGYIRALQATSNFIRDGQDLNLRNFSLVDLPLPPCNEQDDIAKVLDYFNRKIDGFIRAKRKLIGLLNEQKQAIIHRAVTRGLDPNVPLRPSGIPWLGDIPQHWEMRRAKYLFREVDERSKTGNEELLSVSHITGISPRSQKNVTMFKAESNIGYKICLIDDLAINTMWAWMAALGVSKYDGIISPAYAVYRRKLTGVLVSEYTDMLLRTSCYKANYLVRSTGIRASRLRLYPEQFFRIPILLPPIHEQQGIAVFAQKETANLNTAIVRTEREIALMQEYRTRLTADVVTGKFDVRSAAASLPAEAGEPAPILDADGDDSDMDEDADA